MMLKSRLKNILDIKGISQKELAEKVGLTESAMSRYVNGSRIPRGEYLMKIAKILNVKVEDLYCE